VDGGSHGRPTPVGGRLVPRPPRREGAPAGNVGPYGTGVLLGDGGDRYFFLFGHFFHSKITQTNKKTSQLLLMQGGSGLHRKFSGKIHIFKRLAAWHLSNIPSILSSIICLFRFPFICLFSQSACAFNFLPFHPISFATEELCQYTVNKGR